MWAAIKESKNWVVFSRSLVKSQIRFLNFSVDSHFWFSLIHNLKKFLIMYQKCFFWKQAQSLHQLKLKRWNNASVKQAICNWYGNGSLIDQHRKNHPKSKLTIKVFWPLAASSDYKNTSGKLLDRAAITSSSSAITKK